MTLTELKNYIKQKGYSIKIRTNVTKIPNYRDYVIYLYKPNSKFYCYAWDVCYGEHWANQEDKVFKEIIKYTENDRF